MSTPSALIDATPGLLLLQVPKGEPSDNAAVLPTHTGFGVIVNGDVGSGLTESTAVMVQPVANV